MRWCEMVGDGWEMVGRWLGDGREIVGRWCEKVGRW